MSLEPQCETLSRLAFQRVVSSLLCDICIWPITWLPSPAALPGYAHDPPWLTVGPSSGVPPWTLPLQSSHGGPSPEDMNTQGA